MKIEEQRYLILLGSTKKHGNKWRLSLMGRGGSGRQFLLVHAWGTGPYPVLGFVPWLRIKDFGKLSWGMEEQFPSLLPAAAFFQVLPNAFVFMGDDFQGVEGLGRMGDPKAIFSSRDSRMVGSEQTIPDYQYAPEVLVNVLRVLAMMDLVELRGVEYFFHPSQGGDLAGMQPELIAGIDGHGGEHHHRVEPHQGHPEPENGLIEKDHPAVAE